MTHPRYKTRAWRTGARVGLRRDGYECQLKLPGCLGLANSVDHIVRQEDGGDESTPTTSKPPAGPAIPQNAIRRSQNVPVASTHRPEMVTPRFSWGRGEKHDLGGLGVAPRFSKAPHAPTRKVIHDG